MAFASLFTVMRLDRAATLYVARPCRRLLGGGPNGRQAGIPILMYHSISDGPEKRGPAYFWTRTRPADFRRQMRWLCDHGYRSISLSDALNPLPDRPTPETGREKLVVITFDDGFRDFATEAFPVLREYGLTATMFLPTAYIGNARRSFSGTECLTWEEVRELRRAGMHFGSHTLTHPKLVELPWDSVRRELKESKLEMEEQLTETVDTFAYPFALPQGDRSFTRRFRDLMVECGYRSCVTTEIGCARAGDDPLQLKRLPVNSADDDALFDAKLQGAYDWLAVPQSIAKTARRWISRTPRPAAAVPSQAAGKPSISRPALNRPRQP